MRHLRAYIGYKLMSVRRIYRLVKRFPALQVALGLSLGIILFGIDPSLGFAAVICVSIIGRKAALPSTIAIFIGGGIYLASLSSQVTHNLYGQTVSVTATVISNPVLRDYDQQAIIRSADVYGDILANIPKYPQISLGDQLVLDLQLKDPKLSAKDGYLEFLTSNGIKYLASTDRSTLTKNTSFLQQLKQGIISTVNRSLGEPQAGLLLGMLIGETGSFDPKLENALRASGTSHIVSVSGFNVSVLLLILLKLSGSVNRRQLILLIPLLLLSYLAIVGWGNLPAKRAVFMSVGMFLPLAIGRQTGIYLGIVYAAVWMLLENPLVWRNVSFELSLAALLGILLLANSLQHLLRKLPQAIAGGIATTTAALIATTPITVINFGQLSLMALPANLVVLPAVPLAMYAGILAICCSRVPLVGDFWFWLTNLLLRFIISTVEMVGNLPFAVTQNPLLIILTYLAMILFWVVADYVYFYHRIRSAIL